MTRLQLVRIMAERAGLHQAQVEIFFEELVKLAVAEARNGFPIPGIGKLVLVDRKSRMGRHPVTGAPIHIPASQTVKFRVSKSCREAVRRGTPPARPADPPPPGGFDAIPWDRC